jgi:hypothetical protein
MDIEKFYKDKKKYERLELVLLKDGKKPKCFYCKKSVGMIFEISPSSLLAECGAHNSPEGCDYKLEIVKDKYIQIDTKLSSIKSIIDMVEEDIISVKFNHLFKFTTTEQTTVEFETLKQRLETLKTEYASLLQKKYIPNNKLIDETKTDLQRVINEIKNIDNFREIINIQNTTINKLNSTIDTLSYKHKEVIYSKDNEPHYRLLTQPYTILSNEIKL